MGVLKRCSLSLAVFGVALAAAPQAHAQAAIISNGANVSLGVNAAGALNVACDRAVPGAIGNPRCDAVFAGSGIGGNPGVGVMSNKTVHEFTYDGCTCEGWGAGVSGGTFDGVWDGQNTSSGPTVPRSAPVFTFTGSTATSTVDICTDDGFGGCGTAFMSVKQFYHPSGNPDLYQVDVTLTNLTGDVLGVGPDGIRYRREMDWDIEPTQFDEYSTIHGSGASAVVGTSDDGFASSNPFDGDGIQGCDPTLVVNTDFHHSGPCDHGARFDFGFPALGVGESRTFTIFYGVADNEAQALIDLGLVSADDVYSFGQSNCAGVVGNVDDPCVAGEETAIFAFKGVGGHTLGTPEPASIALMGTGLVGLAGFARRRRRVEQQ